VSAELFGKGHLRVLRVRETPTRPSRRIWKRPWTKTGLKHCSGRLFGLYHELESESQNGNPSFTFAN
jgi:hypothetical protein